MKDPVTKAKKRILKLLWQTSGEPARSTDDAISVILQKLQSDVYQDAFSIVNNRMRQWSSGKCCDNCNCQALHASRLDLKTRARAASRLRLIKLD